MADARPSILIVAAAALALGGCSVNHSNEDLVAGKKDFVAKCGACHTLSHAGTKGTQGPNLDQAFREDVKENFGTGAIAGVVRGQIKDPGTYPKGHGTGIPAGEPGAVAMPAKLFTGKRADNVAAYVAHVAGKGGKDEGLLATAVAAAGGGKPVVEKAGKLAFVADPNGQLAYTSTAATATAGSVTISLANASGTPHNIAIQQGTGATSTVIAKTAIVPKGDKTVTATLKPGKYTFFCEVPGHRQAGMAGTLTVK